jgi:uncharacterized protein DUF5134
VSPDWLLDAFAALMLAVAAVSAARLVAARRWRRGAVAVDSDAAHLLMAIAMAGMLAPGLSTLPDRAWEVIFGLLAAWFAVRVTRDARANGVRALAGGHCAPHLVHSCSMVYMFTAMTSAAAGMAGMDAMAGMPGGAGSAMMTLRYPALALVFAFILAGYSIWDLDQVSGRRYRLEAPRMSLAGAVPGVGVPALAAAGGRPGTVGAAGGGSASVGVAAAEGLPVADDLPAADGAGGAEDASAAEGGGAAAGAADRAGAGSRAFLLSPAVTIGCRVAMGVAMAFMLIIAI